ncbi:hypothetical protein [Rhodococcus phenolicus]|uniref:hypothetical protein n=1 Tax=Rhodococcus phenolicus TaxID=263849 RepID=UPI00082FF767|nr:hypothetical protein [Rhodococcus phenolicus]
MNASGKNDGGFHKVTPDPEETPQDEDVRSEGSGDGTDGDYDATGPAHRAGEEGGRAERSGGTEET